jgi:chorismate dehydratase
LRVGCVKYLNARPLIHSWEGKVTLADPATLCRQLAHGDLDIALVSSFEFLRNPIYRIVDDVSISSDGPVYSVIVAYSGETPLPEFELDPASQTSVVLLQFLVTHGGATFRSVQTFPDVLAPLQRSRSRLLIGDQAIRFRQKYTDRYRYWDLGAEWKGLTKLPFVYALWLVRPEASWASQMGKQLRTLRDTNLRHLDNVIAQEREFDPAFCRRYYRENLRFSLGDREKQGLQEFANACAKLDLIPKRELKLQLV